MDLVIMAAGMGSRFGGLKQVEPVNANGEFILDYSIYDAIKAGFDRIVFIIKEENYNLFRETVGKRIEEKIKVEYVFQDMKNIPEGTSVPQDRIKPLGTGHAIYCLNGVVSDKFAIINADDFYGRDAFKVLHDFLAKNDDKTAFGCVVYKIGESLSQNGAAKRGLCMVEDGEVKRIVESSVDRIDGVIKAEPLSGEESFVVGDDNPVSMNMFALNSHLFPYLNARFKDFFEENKDNMMKAEYLIPTVITEMMDGGMAKLVSIGTDAKWYGVTYKEDKQELVDYIESQTLLGVYPRELWK
ncbi:MAG: nucleotidyltransferase [Clostridia bacterium]|nr:nucleotidyltransferase [Clostridia bacterium]